MKSSFKRIGELIQLTEEKNKNNSISELLGINISKNFMPSVANVSGTDLSKYKVIKRNVFACNIMHVGRDERLPIALYKANEPAIVSPAYKTFKVNDEKIVISDYLMIIFQRKEFDRLTWYYCDSSIRGGLDWDRFCEIEIPLPTVDVQKNYVKMYKALLANQQLCANSLDGLRLICNAFIDDQVSKGITKRLGAYIQQTETKNTNSANRNVLGISVQKKFIPSRANRDDLNVSNYKLIKDKQFGYVSVTSRNGDKISIAILNGPEGVISSTYIAFEVIDLDKLLPEYLYLWFSRQEFDRYVRYHSWGSARETFDWADMCEVELPLPSIDEQKAIVAIHKVLEKRKKINEQLKSAIQPLCPVLIQGVLQELDQVN